MANFNWRRELLLISMAGMEVSWLAGWVVILLGPGQTAGLVTAWVSAFALYLIATTTARTLIRRRTTRIDWIIGGLALASTLVFVNLNLYPDISPFSPRWLGTLIGNITSRLQAWPRELTGLLIGFFIWFRGLRLPGRHAGIRTMTRHLQIGLVITVGLAIASTGFPVDVGGVIVAYFAASLLSLALTRIEETAHAEGGTAPRFGRKWLLTLAAASLIVGAITLIASHILTVETVRALLRPVAILATVILSAFALLLGVFAQYVLFPIIIGLFVRLFPEGLDIELPELPQQDAFQAGEAERATSRLINPEVLNALRIIGLFLLVLVVLWLVVRSFRRWRIVHETTAGGTRDTVTPASGLADDVRGYLRDQWQRLRQLADIRRLLQRRGAGSVRAIYANLLTLMAAADRPRRAGQTPYEFEPTVGDALPARVAEVRAITEAYVRARYGERAISDEELRSLREAWRHVQADGEKLIRERQYRSL